MANWYSKEVNGESKVSVECEDGRKGQISARYDNAGCHFFGSVFETEYEVDPKTGTILSEKHTIIDRNPTVNGHAIAQVGIRSGILDEAREPSEGAELFEVEGRRFRPATKGDEGKMGFFSELHISEIPKLSISYFSTAGIHSVDPYRLVYEDGTVAKNPWKYCWVDVTDDSPATDEACEASESAAE